MDRNILKWFTYMILKMDYHRWQLKARCLYWLQLYHWNVFCMVQKGGFARQTANCWRTWRCEKQQMFKTRELNKNIDPLLWALIMIFFLSSSVFLLLLLSAQYALEPLRCDLQWTTKMIYQYHHKCAIMSDFRIFSPLQNVSGRLMDLRHEVTRICLKEVISSLSFTPYHFLTSTSVNSFLFVVDRYKIS